MNRFCLSRVHAAAMLIFTGAVRACGGVSPRRRCLARTTAGRFHSRLGETRPPGASYHVAMKRGYWLRTLAAAMLIFIGATQQLAAYEPYSQFKEFTFVGTGGAFIDVPADMMWVVENVSGRILVMPGVHIITSIVFQQLPTGVLDNVIFPTPILTWPNAIIGDNVRDVYFFNDATRAYYSKPRVTASVISDSDSILTSVSLSLTGYLIPLSTVWTGVTSLEPGDIKEVTITDLQLADALQSGYDYTSLPQFGGGHQVQAGGELRVGPAEQLRFTSTAPLPAVPGQNGPSTYITANYNGGSIELTGNSTNASEIEFLGSLVNASSTGLISGQSAMMRFTGGLDNYGSVAVTAGINNLRGDITNYGGGKLTVTGGAQAVFYDDIVQNGTLRVAKVGSTTSTAVFLGAFTGNGGTTGGGDIFFEGDLRPGNSPANVTFANNVGLGGEANTVIELAGPAVGTQYDQINVTGGLSLDGALSVFLLGGYMPAAGATFDILNWGSLDGTFSSLSLPSLGGGLGWNTSQLYTTGVLSVAVAPGVPGEYNNNGTVDAADYVLWRHSLGRSITLPSDTTPGAVSQADFDVWRANFGTSSGSGSSLGANALVNVAAVPEPSLLVMLLAGLATRLSVRSRYRFLG